MDDSNFQVMLYSDKTMERMQFAPLIKSLGGALCTVFGHLEAPRDRNRLEKAHLHILVISETEHPSPWLWDYLQGKTAGFWMVFCAPTLKENVPNKERYLGRFSRPNLALGSEWQKTFLLVLKAAFRTCRRRLGLPPMDELNPATPSSSQVFEDVKQLWVKPNKLPKHKSAKIIVIGVSTGGPQSLNQMLPYLCEQTQLPILIVQHMGANFTTAFAQSLDQLCSHTCKEATAGELIKEKTVYVAPGNWHMTVMQSGMGPMLQLNQNPPLHSCRPAVDALLPSVGQVYRGKAVVIILTGMGADGSLSLAQLKSLGNVILAQDKESSIVWGMPGAAVATGYVDAVVPLMAIPLAVAEILSD